MQASLGSNCSMCDITCVTIATLDFEKHETGAIWCNTDAIRNKGLWDSKCYGGGQNVVGCTELWGAESFGVQNAMGCGVLWNAGIYGYKVYTIQAFQ